MPTNYTREEQIKSEVVRIEQSTLSANEYIQRYGASFSLIQFYRYRNKLSREGIIGLRDKRKDGNHQKLNSFEMAFLRGFIKSKPNVRTEEARLAIADEFGTQVHRSTMSRILKRLGVKKVHTEDQIVKSLQVSHAGFELIAAMAIHLGWPKHTAQCVMEFVEKKQLDSQPNKPVDKKGRNSKGQFTRRYNKRPSIRKMRFASIELKRSKKELQRMDIFNTSIKNLERKALAILALPLVTLNGEVRHVNAALGNALKGFCGYNYKQATLDQFLRELKYLGISESLLGSQVPFWYEKWKESGSKLELPFLCYYIDGNTKPVWSKYQVMQSDYARACDGMLRTSICA